MAMDARAVRGVFLQQQVGHEGGTEPWAPVTPRGWVEGATSLSVREPEQKPRARPSGAGKHGAASALGSRGRVSLPNPLPAAGTVSLRSSTGGNAAWPEPSRGDQSVRMPWGCWWGRCQRCEGAVNSCAGCHLGDLPRGSPSGVPSQGRQALARPQNRSWKCSVQNIQSPDCEVLPRDAMVVPWLVWGGSSVSRPPPHPRRRQTPKSAGAQVPQKHLV